MEMNHCSYIKYAKKKFSSKPVKKAAESTIYIDLEHIEPPQQPQPTRNEHHPSGKNCSLSSNLLPTTYEGGNVFIRVCDSVQRGGGGGGGGPWPMMDWNSPLLRSGR